MNKIMIMISVIIFLTLTGCAREDVILTTPRVTNYINSTVNKTYNMEYNSTVLPCTFTENYSFCQELYTCNNGTATILTRNKTIAQNMGCDI